MEPKLVKNKISQKVIKDQLLNTGNSNYKSFEEFKGQGIRSKRNSKADQDALSGWPSENLMQPVKVIRKVKKKVNNFEGTGGFNNLKDLNKHYDLNVNVGDELNDTGQSSRYIVGNGTHHFTPRIMINDYNTAVENTPLNVIKSSYSVGDDINLSATESGHDLTNVVNTPLQNPYLRSIEAIANMKN